ncbi:MAG: NADH:flavin oxidoreductase [bacterium]|nr:NADH:flavin oxidoreductase [bacterium]
MPNLFDPLAINTLEIKNRFVRSATMDTLADEGKVTDDLLALYRELVEGETGLVITGGIYVRKDGQIVPGELAADTDETIPSLKKLTDAVHRAGGKIAAQLLHAGWGSHPNITGSQPLAPSPIVHPFMKEESRELSGDEILELIDAYVQAAQRAVEAGFDAVQLHSAHGRLPCTFLSPAANRREDEWGGSPENRARFLRLICQGIRARVGRDYPILVKLGLKDYHPEGKPLAEGISTAKALESDGVDCIEVSEGFEAELHYHIRRDEMSPYYTEECRQTRQALSIPLIQVGGMRELKDMQSILDNGTADAVSMCRPFIMDPHIVRKFREKLTHESDCISCNDCFKFLPGVRFQCAQI